MDNKDRYSGDRRSEQGERESAGNGPSLDSSALSGMLSAIMSNPELVANIKSAIGGAASPAQPSGGTSPEDRENGGEKINQEEKLQEAPPGLDGLFANKELLQKLPELISVMKPMMGMGKGGGKSGLPQEGKRTDERRTALLCALKPYLSDSRKNAIDQIISISRITELIKSMY